MVAQWEQQIFGCQPSVLFMQKLPWLAVSELFYASYFSYYVMIVGVGIALFLRSRQQFFHYVSVVSFLFYVCYLIYIFLPVIGSRAFFRQVDGYVLPAATQQLAVTDAYPEAVQAGVFFHIMKWIYRVFEAPGAAFPSSHVAVALCTVFFSFRYLRPIRYLHLAVAVPALPFDGLLPLPLCGGCPGRAGRRRRADPHRQLALFQVQQARPGRVMAAHSRSCRGRPWNRWAKTSLTSAASVLSVLSSDGVRSGLLAAGHALPISCPHVV